MGDCSIYTQRSILRSLLFCAVQSPLLHRFVGMDKFGCHHATLSKRKSGVQAQHAAAYEVNQFENRSAAEPNKVGRSARNGCT